MMRLEEKVDKAPHVPCRSSLHKCLPAVSGSLPLYAAKVRLAHILNVAVTQASLKGLKEILLCIPAHLGHLSGPSSDNCSFAIKVQLSSQGL